MHTLYVLNAVDHLFTRALLSLFFVSFSLQKKKKTKSLAAAAAVAVIVGLQTKR